MLIAGIVIIAVFIVFITITYIMMIKNYKFVIDGKVLKVHNQGSRLTISVDDKVVAIQNMPQLMHGESYDVEINEKKYIVKCKCNSFGTKFRVEIYDGETLITDNGVVLKEKSPKVKKTKETKTEIKEKEESKDSLSHEEKKEAEEEK